MLPALYRAAKASPWQFRHPWLVLGLGVCLYCTQLAPPLYSIASIGAGRIVNTYYISFVVLWFVYVYYLAGAAARRGPQLDIVWDARRCATLFTACACLFAIGCLGYKRAEDPLCGVQNLSGPSAALSLWSGEAEQYDREMTEREQLLNDETQPVVALEPLTARPAVFMDDLLQPGAVYDVRPTLCHYYGKEAIVLSGGEVAP